MKKILLIDNYDSFTYNLVQVIQEQLDIQVDVVRNDAFEMDLPVDYDMILLSPGPGIPAEAGKLLEVIRRFAARKPILGICLGHQAIAEAFGGKLLNLKEVCHGHASKILVDGQRSCLFTGLEEGFEAGRYHSWVVDPATLPECLEVTARTADGQIMALQHKDFPIYGLQFHPESVLSPEGPKSLKNWVQNALQLSFDFI